MIRELRYTIRDGSCVTSVPESVHICVGSSLTQDAGISGDLYLSGFIPAQIVAYSDNNCRGGGTVISLQYDDAYLSSYDEDLERAATPLKCSDVMGLIRDSCLVRFLKAYADSLVA